MVQSHAEGEILCQKDSFLCAALGTEVSIAFTKKFGAGLFGGEGFILQKLKGDGMAFLHAGGTVVKKELRGEVLRVDTGCIVGFTSGISYDVKMSGGLKSMFFGNGPQLLNESLHHFRIGRQFSAWSLNRLPLRI